MLKIEKGTFLRFIIGSLLISFGLVITNPSIDLIAESPLLQSLIGIILFIIGVTVLLSEFASFIITEIVAKQSNQLDSVLTSLDTTATQMKMFKRDLPNSALSNKEKLRVAKYLDRVLDDVTTGNIEVQWISSFMDDNFSTLLMEARKGAKMISHGYEENKFVYVIDGKVIHHFPDNERDDKTIHRGETGAIDAGMKHEVSFVEDTLYLAVFIPPVEVGSVDVNGSDVE